ncbi:Protein transport protein SFT2 [Glycine soja]|uniref:Vesicle transport protein n=1 Tax=Glycine soja TaxID=3848 RepID=A0A445JNR8_GLYSO|nr:Protein transport protein SFT2 [Glycine soja]
MPRSNHRTAELKGKSKKKIDSPKFCTSGKQTRKVGFKNERTAVKEWKGRKKSDTATGNHLRQQRTAETDCGEVGKEIWVSKGVRDLPGNFQSATSNVPSGKALVYFGLFLASGVFFVFIAFTLFLPVMVVMPQKFALCFTLGCGFIIGSFFALKGPKSQLAHMLSKERLPFTLAFLGSMIGTIYVSMVLHSYILSVVFSVVQVLSLGYYSISYFPGGSAGMKFLTSAFTSSIMKCFGR